MMMHFTFIRLGWGIPVGVLRVELLPEKTPVDEVEADDDGIEDD